MALVFAFTMIFPFTAFATDTEVLSVPSVNDDARASLGTVFFEFTAGQLDDGDTVTISLPEDFQFLKAGEGQDKVMVNNDWKSVSDDVYGETNGNYFKIPDSYQGDTNGLKGVGLDIDMLDENEIKVTVDGNVNDSWDSYLYLYLGNVWIDGGFDGDIDLRLKAPSTSGFKSGNITVGRVSGGAVDIEVTDLDTFSDYGDVTIRVEEDVPDSLDDTNESLQFTLPDGFVWSSVESVKVYWGKVDGYATNDALADYLEDSLKIDDDELTLDLSKDFDESTQAIAFEIKAKIEVDDETDAKLGDVIAKVDGDSDYSQSEIIVGRYGQYEISITAGEATEIVAGMLEQELPDITIEESIKESLIKGRTVTMTLPSNFKWNKVDEDTDSNTGLEFAGFPGRDGQTAKWIVKDNSTDAAEIVLEAMEVAIEPGTTGDLVIEVGGTAGISEELLVAKVVEPVTITSSEKLSLTIGKADQPIGDLTVTENVAGALSEDDDLLLQLPAGFKWTNYKDIEITEGDLKIDTGSITLGNDDRDLLVEIDNDSNTASTIKLTNLEVTVDRTAPEGDVTVKVKGDAVNEVNNASEVEDAYTIKDGYAEVDGEQCFDIDSNHKLFPETSTAAKTIAATVGTPAPTDQKLVTTITLGDNGSYISDGRIMVQLRDAAGALGVAPQNILWDNSTKTATLVKGDRVAQITVGNPQVKLNGMALPTDKGAEIKDGRTFVSLSMAGVALGATAEWDNNTKTATITVN